MKICSLATVRFILVSEIFHCIHISNEGVLLKPPTTDNQPTDYRPANPPLPTNPTTIYQPTYVKIEDQILNMLPILHFLNTLPIYFIEIFNTYLCLTFAE